MALNPIDSEESHFEKRMRNGTVRCDVEASALLVTFPPKELDDEMLITGSVQRFSFIPKTLSLDGRIDNILEDIDRYIKENDLYQKINMLVSGLSEVKDRYKKGSGLENIFQIDHNAAIKFRESEKNLGKKFKKTDLRIQEHIGGMLSSTVRKISAISMQIAALTGRKTITGNDVEYAINNVVEPQLDLMHIYLESRPEHTIHGERQDEEFNKFKRYYNGEPKSKMEFLGIIGKSLSLTSYGSQNRRFKSWEDQGLIVKNIDGKYIVKYTIPG